MSLIDIIIISAIHDAAISLLVLLAKLIVAVHFYTETPPVRL